jgi:hypothetical protein
LRLLSLALDFTARSRVTFRKPDAYGQVYCHVLHLWMGRSRVIASSGNATGICSSVANAISNSGACRVLCLRALHRGESGEFTHRPQSNEIRANSRITRGSLDTTGNDNLTDPL